MELDRLIECLSDPAAYSEPVAGVEVRQTHISVVFLAGGHAYKVKKPVNLGFLDFSTLARRRHFCEEEVRLNRRLAPAVYRGVVPVTQNGGRVRMEGRGEAVEWAVKMKRLPDEATLQKRLLRGEVGPDLVHALARKVAAFHARADSGKRIAAFGRFPVVARNARENFAQSLLQVGVTVSPAVFARLRSLTEEGLTHLRPLVAARARRGVPRDTHGDLRLDHVYVFPDRPPPEDLVVIDCIEFNERFRFADPVADMAFLAMDLAFHGRRDLAWAFADAYFEAAGDEEGRELLPFYTAYRAVVRAKVEGFELTEREIPAEEKEAALARARAHWLLALTELEAPGRRPCLVLVGGVPGSGKSTLAAGLGERAGFTVQRTDVVRKELAGLAPQEPVAAPCRESLYTPERIEHVYAECLRRAEGLLCEGRRVLVDANFKEESRRQAFLAGAARLGVPAVCLLCQAPPETARARIGARRNDASDADWSIYCQAVECWEEPGPATRPVTCPILTAGTAEQTLDLALAALERFGLWA
jgi:aminoglycoside phosphotransferase family enzyme/predicted kinase